MGPQIDKKPTGRYKPETDGGPITVGKNWPLPDRKPTPGGPILDGDEIL